MSTDLTPRLVHLHRAPCAVCGQPATHLALPARVVIHGAAANWCPLPPLDTRKGARR